MKKFESARIVENLARVLVGGMFISMSFAALTIALSAAMNVI